MTLPNASDSDTEERPAPPGDTQSVLPAFDISVDALLPPVPVVEKTTSLGGPLEDPGLPRDPRLIILSGGHENDILTIPKDRPFVIGRAEGCDLTLDDEGVSRRHAQVTLTPDGCLLEDLGSRNGVFIGNQKVQHHRLMPDDIIRVGVQTIIKFSMMDPLEEEYQRRLLQAALRDSLTGLYNRRHFDERLTAESAACRRHGRLLSLAIFDIDNFKQLNDKYGHSVGDEALREVARGLSHQARKEDSIFRYGGEEFCILFRETGIEGAIKATERRREHIERSTVRFMGKELHLTVSAGVAEWKPDDDEISLLKRADRALYEAKHLGKNRVRIAP
ncbi:MAG: GGDEF domain-containing protein [Deltaproteobacteria bacterium]|nr:GGDEF domain-containing protein [Deltaproteobacteria bacterium]